MQLVLLLNTDVINYNVASGILASFVPNFISNKSHQI